MIRPGSAQPSRAPRRLQPLKVVPARPSSPAEVKAFGSKLEQHYLTVRGNNVLAEKQMLARIEQKRAENPGHVPTLWNEESGYDQGGRRIGPKPRRRRSLFTGPPRNLGATILFVQFLALILAVCGATLPWYTGHVDEDAALAIAESGAELSVGAIVITAAQTCVGDRDGEVNTARMRVCKPNEAGVLASVSLAVGLLLLSSVLIASIFCGCASCRNRCCYGFSATQSAVMFIAATASAFVMKMPASFRVAFDDGLICLIIAMLLSCLSVALTWKHIDPWVEEEQRERGKAIIDKRGNVTMVKTERPVMTMSDLANFKKMKQARV